jgi:hypothetical protein
MPEENSPKSIDGGFFLQWVFATGISMAIGMGGTAMAIFKINSLGVLPWAIGLLGFLPGLAQWLVLRRYISRAGWWILATVGGFILTLGPAALTYRANLFIRQREVNVIIGFLVMLVLLVLTPLFYGAATGTMQWFVLRNQVNGAVRWIDTSAIGWFVSILMVLTIGGVGYLLMSIFIMIDAIVGLMDLYFIADTIYTWMSALLGFIMGVMAGAITGRSLMRLLQETAANSKEIIA